MLLVREYGLVALAMLGMTALGFYVCYLAVMVLKSVWRWIKGSNDGDSD